MAYYGLDVHKETIQFCKMSPKGEILQEDKFPSRVEEISEFAETLTERDHVVLEATFNSWAVVRLLQTSEAEIVVANSLQVKAIAHAKVKTDKIDAKILAHLLRSDFIPRVPIPTGDTVQLRELMSHRRFMIQRRTAVKNTIRGILNKRLIEWPEGKDLYTQKGIKWLKELELSEIDRLMMDNCLNVLLGVEQAVKKIDVYITEHAANDPNIKLLMTIPGMDLVCASGINAVIDDINLFDDPNKLTSYFGLVPRVHSSGNTTIHGRITKAGSANGRWLAVQAAHGMVLSNTPMTATYYRVKRKKGSQKATVALARKIIALVWHMLKKQEPYRYAPYTKTMRKLKKVCPGAAKNITKKNDLQELYRAMGLPTNSEATEAEKKCAKVNRAAVTRIKNIERQCKKSSKKTKG